MPTVTHPKGKISGRQIPFGDTANTVAEGDHVHTTPGVTGPAGPTGPASFVTGPTGLSGAAGATGPTGIQGTVGGVGATGPTGIQGTVGGVGATGPTGIQGTVGGVGATGPTGIQGTVGGVGATGPTGIQGTVGGVGATGPTGIQGTVGGVGATGPTGAASTVAGPTGPGGVVGATGPTGSFAVPGSTTQVIYNNAGALAGDAGFTYNQATDLITLAGLAGTGTRMVTTTPAGLLGSAAFDPDLATLSIPANTTISAYGATLVDDADATTARTTLGLGAIATQPIPGSTTQVIFNDAGVLAGDAGLVYNKTTDVLTNNSNNGGIVLNAPTAGQQAQLSFNDAGTNKWVFYKQNDNDLAIYNTALGRDDLVITTGTGAMLLTNLAGTGTRVVEASSTGVLSASKLAGMDLITTSAPSAVSTVSLDNCFTTTYDSYLIIARLAQSATSAQCYWKMRAAGADNNTAVYYWQNVVGVTAETAAASTFFQLNPASGAAFSDSLLWLVINQPQDVARTVAAGTWTSRYTTPGLNHRLLGWEYDNTTQFDGFTIGLTTGGLTGNIRVYGIRDA